MPVQIIQSDFSSPGANDKRIKIHVALKALGKLGIWLSDGKHRKVDDLMVMLKNQVVPAGTVSIDADHVEGAEAAVLVIDLERAWDDMKIDAGWSNEVPVDVYIQ